MNFTLIETPRLILKGISPEEMTHIFESYSKPEIMKILGHRSDAAYKSEEYKQKNGYSTYNKSFLLFFLIDKASDTIIGRCGIHNWNSDHRRAEVGYAMEDEGFKRKGLMTEALGAVIDYGFTTLNLHRMEALVGTNNIPSLRLMEIYNFAKEGVFREHWFVNDKFEDSVTFSILRNDYMTSKGG